MSNEEKNLAMLVGLFIFCFLVPMTILVVVIDIHSDINSSEANNEEKYECPTPYWYYDDQCSAEEFHVDKQGVWCNKRLMCENE